MQTLAASKFSTFGDPHLAAMLVAAKRFAADLKDACPQRHPRMMRGRWLTFLGTSGTGKTMLSRDLLRHWDEHCARWLNVVDVWQTRRALWLSWANCVNRMRGGDFSDRDTLASVDFAVIDELGAENDRSGFAREQLFCVLDARVGKWTVITGNLMLQAISEQLDTRIADRLIRDENVCVQVDTLSFALRAPELRATC